MSAERLARIDTLCRKAVADGDVPGVVALVARRGKIVYYKAFSLAFGVLTPEVQGKGGKGSAGTFEWGGYFNTQYFADPREKVIGILTKQTQGPTTDKTADLFRQLVMQGIDD